MRLNRIESFYAFLLRFRSEGSEEQGRPATASPHAGPATHGQALAKGPGKEVAGCGQGQPAREVDVARGQQPAGAMLVGTVGYGQPAGATAASGHTRLQRDAHKVGQLQGVCKGLPPTTSPTISKGSSVGRRGGHPLAGWLSTG
ncbi:hypothetical protein BHM03_00048317 [Ensete ventricosum]|nr:hypothetical protein BHM03_00048317 [Ensete ventricosum]